MDLDVLQADRKSHKKTQINRKRFRHLVERFKRSIRKTVEETTTKSLLGKASNENPLKVNNF